MNERERLHRALFGFVWGGLMWQSVADLTTPVIAAFVWLAIAIVGTVAFIVTNRKAAR